MPVPERPLPNDNQREVFPEQVFDSGRLWPVSEALLDSLPSQLRHSYGERGIATCQFPWEALPFFLENLRIAVQENPRISADVNIPSSVTIEGSVIIESGARIEPNAVIIGPSWIDTNATVHAFSFIQESYIGSGVRTGRYTELNRCVVGSGSRFHRGDFEDSIFGLKLLLA
ncbi:MAG TPA: hypothetical protein VLF89_04995 [Candidatus Saccharimonadales bacterium]|nr:hypothetical protein [Candidatus Saccharimonadales bacterium]